MRFYLSDRDVTEQVGYASNKIVSGINVDRGRKSIFSGIIPDRMGRVLEGYGNLREVD